MFHTGPARHAMGSQTGHAPRRPCAKAASCVRPNVYVSGQDLMRRAGRPCFWDWFAVHFPFRCAAAACRTTGFAERPAEPGCPITEGVRDEQTRRKPERRRKARRRTSGRKPSERPQQDREPVGRRARQQSATVAVTEQRGGLPDRGAAPALRCGSTAGPAQLFLPGRFTTGACPSPDLRGPPRGSRAVARSTLRGPVCRLVRGRGPPKDVWRASRCSRR